MPDLIEFEKEELNEKLMVLRAEAKVEDEKIRRAAKEMSDKVYPDAEAKFDAWQNLVRRWQSIQQEVIAIDEQLEQLRIYQEARDNTDRNLDQIFPNPALGVSPIDCNKYDDLSMMREHEWEEQAKEYYLDRQAEMQALYGDERNLDDLEYRDMKKLLKQDQRLQNPLVSKPNEETAEREESIDSSRGERKRSQSAKQKNGHSRRHDHRLEIDF